MSAPALDPPRIPVADMGVLACSPQAFSERAFRMTLAGLRENEAPADLDRIHLPRDRWAMIIGLYEVIFQRREPEFDAMITLPGNFAMDMLKAALAALRERKDAGIDEAHRAVLRIFAALREHEADEWDFPYIPPMP